MARKNRLRGSVLAVVSATLAGTATAQQSSGGLEEIVVTARKREQSVQEVPLSISAFDESSYRDLTRGTLDGLAAQVTNLQAYGTNSFLQSVHIRGIGLNEFQGQYDSPVAQHVDEVYFSKPWMTARRQYDIARVEVLKGPQGTLFGRNTTGGALNYYTQAPSQDFDAGFELGFDEHERYRLGGMLNGGLTDRLSGRVAFNSEFGDGGPQDNLFTQDEHGKPDLYDVRAQLLWEGDQLDRSRARSRRQGPERESGLEGSGHLQSSAHAGYCPQTLTGRGLQRSIRLLEVRGFRDTARVIRRASSSPTTRSRSTRTRHPRSTTRSTAATCASSTTWAGRSSRRSPRRNTTSASTARTARATSSTRRARTTTTR